MKIILIFIPLLLFSCRDNKKNDTMIKETVSLMKNDTLIDGIKIENNLMFDKDDIYLKTFKYNGSFIENIKISDLLNVGYRHNFIKYLEESKNENDELKSSLICQLLLMRMVQLSDSNSFYILSEISKNELVSYNGLELYENLLIELFLQDPHFFIQQSVKYNDSSIIDYIIKILPEYFIDQDFLDMNLGFIKGNIKKEDLLLMESKNQKLITYKPLLNKIGLMPKVEIQLGPSFYTNFETQNLHFINIFSVFGNGLSNKFNTAEKDFYDEKILSVLEKKIIRKNLETGIIQDPDGYTNLRKEKSSSSEVLQKIKSGEKVDVIDNTGDWWKVKTEEAKTGYVHKSRIKSGNSINHSTSFLLYDRPDFSSFSKEILTKDDIEIVHQSLGWNFVKIDGFSGYIPTEEKQQELLKEEKRKLSFLADEGDIKPETKKGFWENLFG